MKKDLATSPGTLYFRESIGEWPLLSPDLYSREYVVPPCAEERLHLLPPDMDGFDLFTKVRYVFLYPSV